MGLPKPAEAPPPPPELGAGVTEYMRRLRESDRRARSRKQRRSGSDLLVTTSTRPGLHAAIKDLCQVLSEREGRRVSINAWVLDTLENAVLQAGEELEDEEE